MDKNRRLTHGTLEGYKSFRCRCKKCKEVWELYISEYKAEIFDETKAKYKPIRFSVSDVDYSERQERGYGKP